MDFAIVLALGAMFLWGFGDFFIEKATRKVGDWVTLFVISLVGVLVLFPFVYNSIIDLFSIGVNNLLTLLLLSISLLVATLLGFEALKQGKLSVVDPLYALEIPVAGILALIILKETLDYSQTLSIAFLVIGLFMLSLRNKISKQDLLEKGVKFAVAGSVIMGATSFLLGLSARLNKPLLTAWFMNLFLAVSCFLYFVFKRRVKSTFSEIKKNNKPLLASSLLDNIAWIFYAIALVSSSIAVIVALVQCSVIINALLGIYLNHEKLKPTQLAGLFIAIISSILLSVLSI